tara:strand:+ start:687 stop:890 length:204 start_codon:yes stop_codon:yes gene_type:complete
MVFNAYSLFDPSSHYHTCARLLWQCVDSAAVDPLASAGAGRCPELSIQQATPKDNIRNGSKKKKTKE